MIRLYWIEMHKGSSNERKQKYLAGNWNQSINIFSVSCIRNITLRVTANLLLPCFDWIGYLSKSLSEKPHYPHLSNHNAIPIQQNLHISESPYHIPLPQNLIQAIEFNLCSEHHPELKPILYICHLAKGHCKLQKLSKRLPNKRRLYLDSFEEDDFIR